LTIYKGNSAKQLFQIILQLLNFL